MWAQVWDVLRVVLMVVGALTLWALITAPVAVWVLRSTRRVRVDPPTVAAPPGPPEGRRASSWSEVPSWVKHDKEWAAAVVLLGSDAIADKTTPYVDFPARRIDWLGLRLEAGDWPAQERLLVEVAYDLAYGQHDGIESAVHMPVTVADLAERLNASELDLVHEAVTLRRGR
ncbi:hypothetical protein BH20ACT6_BH20ACT6_21870 [soil metagenome]